MIKIEQVLISMNGAAVLVTGSLEIQSIRTELKFSLIEEDLYAAANADGRASWENIDLVTVAKTKLDLDCTLA